MARRAPLVAGAAAGLVVLAGAIGGGMVLAEGNPTPTATPTQQAAPNGNAPTNRQQSMDDYLQKLAQNLGIDVQKLKDGLKQTALDEVDQRLKDGKITQAQADKLKSEIQNGNGFLFGPGIPPIGGHVGPRGGPGAGPALGPLMIGGQDALNKFATWLGSDTTTLQNDLKGGKTLAQEAADHGKSRDDLKQYLTSSIDDALKQLVAKGALTQDRADAMKQKLTGDLDSLIDGKLPAIGRGFPGHKGGPNPATPNQTPQATPGSSRGSFNSGPRTIS